MAFNFIKHAILCTFSKLQIILQGNSQQGILRGLDALFIIIILRSLFCCFNTGYITFIKITYPVDLYFDRLIVANTTENSLLTHITKLVFYILFLKKNISYF